MLSAARQHEEQALQAPLVMRQEVHWQGLLGIADGQVNMHEQKAVLTCLRPVLASAPLMFWQL